MKGIIACVLGLLASGCFSLGGGGKPIETRSFDLQPPLPAGVPPDAFGAEVLWVEPFSVDPALDRREIVWRRGGDESGAWERFTWSRPPAESVREFAAHAIRGSGACAVVATEPRVPAPDYILRGHLARFEEVDGAKEWSGSLEVRITLVRVADGEEILRRTYATSQKASVRNPGAVVAALRTCLETVNRSLAQDVAEILDAEREPAPAK